MTTLQPVERGDGRYNLDYTKGEDVFTLATNLRNMFRNLNASKAGLQPLASLIDKYAPVGERSLVVQGIADDVARHISDAYNPDTKEFRQQVYEMRIEGNDQYSLVLVIGSGTKVAPTRSWVWPQPAPQLAPAIQQIPPP